MPRDEQAKLLGQGAPWGRGTVPAAPAMPGQARGAAICFGIAALILALTFVPLGMAASQEDAPPALLILLASDRPAYGPGMAATFTLAVDNPSQSAVAVTLPSAQVYDIVVLAGEAEVWRWSVDYAFAAALSERSFAPGVTLLGRETWDWRAADGALLPPGTYRVVGSLASAPPLDGNPVEIVLTVP